jgi:SAM-dependent methyltransferase
MLSTAVRILFGRTPPPSVETATKRHASDVKIKIPSITDPVKVDSRPPTAWPPSRMALCDDLWGDGFTFPGGEGEILRLTRPLGISSASSLLIVGVGSGGPAVVAARNLGAWVSGVDHDPALLAAADRLVTRSQLTKKITLKLWDPDIPAFGNNSHHHCLALGPFQGSQPEPIAEALARAVKPGGQLVITELVADEPLNPNDPQVRRWSELENRDPSHLLGSVAITRMLGRIGLDVRVAENVSDRHMEHALLGWRMMLRELEEVKPTPQQAVRLVQEAELWLLRRRLIRDGRLRMMRWHALSRPPSVQ